MRMSDTVLGGILLVFAIAVALWSQTFPPIPGQEYGAAVFPTLVAAGFAGCGLILLVAGVRQGGPALYLTDWAREAHGPRNVLVTIAAILFYILAARTLGFIPTMAAILLVMFILLGVGWPASIALAILVTLIVHYVFVSFLYVPLPWGLLERWRW